MRKKKRIVLLFTTVCLLGALLTGCGLHSASDSKTVRGTTETASPVDNTSVTDNEGNTANIENAVSAETPHKTAEGKWHVLDPETAAAVDADFIGTIRHIAEGAFSITETQIQVMDDGSITGSSFSSNADVPDSLLIHVVVDDDTYFYIRTISASGDSYEDAEAGFGDLQDHMSVELKGSFENDVFYASEVRMIKTS